MRRRSQKLALVAPNTFPPTVVTRELLEKPAEVGGRNDPNSVIIVVENEKIISVIETSSKVHESAMYQEAIFDLVHSR